MQKGSYKMLLIFLTIGILAFSTTNSCKRNIDTATSSTISLSPDFPQSQIDYDQSYDKVQTQFDEKMWQTFIALCWPADGLKPVAKVGSKITDQKDARPVFENYSFNYDLFMLNLRDGTDFKPIGWGQTDSLDLQRRARWEIWSKKDDFCPDLIALAKEKKITNMASIVPLDEFIQASNDERPHVPIVDKNRNFVWSSVVFNETTFDFVVNNKLYCAEGIELAREKVKLEEVHHVEVVNAKTKDYQDKAVEQKVYQVQDSYGGMHLKTSWVILEDDDDDSKYHTAWGATLFNNLNTIDSTAVIPQCSLVKVGLVGMHIAVKTADQPNFIWATFEHVDNCPEEGKIEDRNYTFYNPAEPNVINKPDSTQNIGHGYADPKWFNPLVKNNLASQVLRQVPIEKGTAAVNKLYQDALTNSVWANYELISTQWTEPASGKIYPDLLSNTTLETFDQLGSSCIGCHRQVTPNSFINDTINHFQLTMGDFPVGNILNVYLNYRDQTHPDSIPTAIYSDYMWSLLKWSEELPIGNLTWNQVKK